MKKRYATFTERLGAVIIDWILFLAIGIFFHIGSNNYSLFTMIISLAYNTWMVGTYGATIGKRIMGVVVTQENGKKLSYSDALVRELAKYLSALILCIGYFAMIWDRRHQTWHDKIARAVVIRR